MRLRAARPTSIAAVAVLSLVLVACAEPQYRYVRNTRSKTAFRVPSFWTVFDESALSGTDSATDTPDGVDWLVGIDGDPAPQLGHIFPNSYATDHPQGVAAVLTLTGQARDEASLADLRNLLIPVDQIQDEVGSEAIRLLVYDDRLMRDGYRGMHMVVQVKASALAGRPAPAGQEGGAGGDEPGFLADEYVQLNQISYLDDSTEHAYVLALRCNADCYARNRSDIESAIDSWTVLP
jgi:hypothetical protein